MSVLFCCFNNQLQHAGTTRASTDRVQTNQGATCVGARRGTQGKTAKQQVVRFASVEIVSDLF